MTFPSDRSRPWRRLLPLGYAAMLLVLFAEPAHAWGPTVHTWIGDAVLKAFALSLPVVADLLRRFRDAYLYGNIAPDVFVGKGSGGHDEHCHNWSAGHALLEAAKRDDERAFALGYMSHLAADVIGHNHFVPNYLYRSFGLRMLGHLYWEMHADNLLAESYVHRAAALITDPAHRGYDDLMERVIDRSPVPLRARKRLFAAYLRLNSHEHARRLMRRVRPYSERSLRHDDIGAQMDLSLALVLAMLRDPSVPHLGRFDPVGARAIREAKKLRRASRRARRFDKSDVAFPIPDELERYRVLLEDASAPLPAHDAHAPIEA